VLYAPRLWVAGAQRDMAFGATEHSSVYAWDLGKRFCAWLLPLPATFREQLCAVGNVNAQAALLSEAMPAQPASSTLQKQPHGHALQKEVPDNGWFLVMHAATGEQVWMKNFLVYGPMTEADVGCVSITPEYGFVGTPVIDLPSSTLFIVAWLLEGPGVFVHRWSAAAALLHGVHGKHMHPGMHASALAGQSAAC
jgi:hypothetical protein